MEIANVEAAEAWDGTEGEHWTEHAERFDRSSTHSRPRLVNASIIGPSDRVLDIGCGTGRATIEAAQLATGGGALGVDLSSQMLALAQERASGEGVDNATCLQRTRRCTPSIRARPTWRSATSAACSSVTR